ncbi:DNA primase [Candidatus Peregrinibacteria bacterium CG_4_9_14_0_2_um_filter_53_11]|nr:MAG: DNA primase [Candidatus Peregrinibacteria bacterium CG_4_9_14_0_2_um_filter_53_11]
MEPIAEIKTRLSIEDLVGQYVQLKKVGRNYRGLCPFHNEKTPSFYVSPDKELAYCFGCRKGGDQFAFIQEVEGLDFREALQFLAEKAHVELPQRTPIQKKQASRRERLLELHDDATSFFEKQLWETKDGAKVLDYLKKRGLTEEIIKKFRLGFAPDERNLLYKYLLKTEYTKSELLEAGVVIAKDTTDQSECFDRFRLRLIFPIMTASGKVCAFGGRAVKEGEQPKYLNSPETPVYHKSELLFGFFQARDAIRHERAVICVEGYMDMLAAFQAGTRQVVATGGTALTEQHLTLLKRFVDTLIFAFDQDNAGRDATRRAIELAIPQDFTLKVARWAEGKDPAELCQKGGGEAFNKIISEALPVMPYLLATSAERHMHDGQIDKKQAVAELIPFILLSPSPIERDEWLKEASSRLGISVNVLYEEIKLGQRQQRSPARRTLAGRGEAGSHEQGRERKITEKQEYLLGLLLTYPSSYGLVYHMKPEDLFDDFELRNIYIHLVNQYNQISEGTDFSLSLEGVEPSMQNRVQLVSLYAESLLKELTEKAAAAEVQEAALSLLRIRFDSRKQQLLSELRQAQGDEQERLLINYQALLQEEQSLTYGQKS